MFQTIVNWYKLYPTAKEFFGHKLTHLFVGGLVGLIFGSCWYVALGLVIVGAICKEYIDHTLLVEDPTNPSDTILYHSLDVAVTTLGGVLGVLSYTLLPFTYLRVVLGSAFIGLSIYTMYLSKQ